MAGMSPAAFAGELVVTSRNSMNSSAVSALYNVSGAQVFCGLEPRTAAQEA
tara:strand:+ start:1287 stop:1439 length:153 start_codon:yes stop_codon:yes gene_type:complete